MNWLSFMFREYESRRLLIHLQNCIVGPLLLVILQVSSVAPFHAKGNRSSLKRLHTRDATCTVEEFNRVVQNTCAEDFEYSSVLKTCILFSNDKLIWADASRSCTARRSHLASILDADMDKAVTTSAKFQSDLWLGLIANNHGWIWFRTAAHPDYTNWAGSAPKSIINTCIYKSKSRNGVWLSAPCHSLKNSYLCEAPAKKLFASINIEVKTDDEKDLTDIAAGRTISITCTGIGYVTTDIFVSIFGEKKKGSSRAIHSKDDKPIQVKELEYFSYRNMCVRKIQAVLSLKTSFLDDNKRMSCCVWNVGLNKECDTSPHTLLIHASPQTPKLMVNSNSALMRAHCGATTAANGNLYWILETRSGDTMTWILPYNKSALYGPPTKGVSIRILIRGRNEYGFTMGSGLNLTLENKFEGVKLTCLTDNINKNTFNLQGKLSSRVHTLKDYPPQTPKISLLEKKQLKLTNKLRVECMATVGSAGTLTWLLLMGEKKALWRIINTDINTQHCLSICHPATITAKPTFNEETGSQIRSVIELNMTAAKDDSLVALLTCMSFELEHFDQSLQGKKHLMKSVKLDYRGGLKIIFPSSNKPLDVPGSNISLLPVIAVLVVLVTAALFYYMNFYQKMSGEESN